MLSELAAFWIGRSTATRSTRSSDDEIFWFWRGITPGLIFVFALLPAFCWFYLAYHVTRASHSLPLGLTTAVVVAATVMLVWSVHGLAWAYLVALTWGFIWLFIDGKKAVQ